MRLPLEVLRSRALMLCCICSLLSVTGWAQISDTTPPHLVSFSFTPNSVDVFASAQSITFTANLTDDLAGIAYVCVQLSSPSRQQTTQSQCLSQISGTALSGVFQGPVSIPQSAEAGTWVVSLVQVGDSAGNNLNLFTADLQALGFPTSLTVNSAAPDTQPPSVTSITFLPSSINVSSGPQNLTMSLNLTDNQSGVDFNRFLEFRITLRSPSGRQEQYVSAQDLQLTSGTPLNGTWQATRLLPRYMEAGTWQISSMWLSDLAGNQVFLPTSTLQSMGITTNFAVISSPADISPPQVTGFTFSPPVIDTATSFRFVTVRMTVTDNLSGVDFSSDRPSVSFLHGVQFMSPSGAQFRYSGGFTLTAGTPANGTWETTAFFPRFSEAGTWTARIFRIKDAVNNFVDLDSTQMATFGFPTQLVIYRPTLTSDGMAGGMGGTVMDTVFGQRASITFPPGVLSGNTDVAIDVLADNLGLPNPAGFQSGTLFVNVDLNPRPAMPLPAPGLTITLPLIAFTTPGSSMALYRLDPATGGLIPAVNVTGGNVFGTVAADGLSATFTGVARLSTLVGFIPTAVVGDVTGDGVVNCADLAIVKSSFGKRTGQAGYDARADLNSDGIVNVVDLGIVARQMAPGTKCP